MAHEHSSRRMPLPLLGAIIGTFVVAFLASALGVLRQLDQGETDIGEIVQWGVFAAMPLGGLVGMIAGGLVGLALSAHRRAGRHTITNE